MDKILSNKKLLIAIAVCILVIVIIALQPPKDGWSTNWNGTSYYLDGEPLTDWQDIDENRYYFGADGFLCTDWQDIGGNRYYFGSDGIMQTGWLKLDDAQYYLNPDGTLATGWQRIEDEQYYLGADGVMRTGIAEVDDGAYLFSEEGHLTCGWTTVGGKLYYGDEMGRPLSGWAKIGEALYYFDETSVAATGWTKIGHFMHYFYTDGAAAQGKLVIDGTTHYFASNGQLLPLVNPWHTIPEDYTVDLVSIGETHKIADIAYQDYLDMITDCKNAGFKPAVCSAYRTQEYQEELYTKRIERYVKAGYSEEKATELAGQVVAVPGTSEHQLGLALDLVDDDNWHLDETQAEMPTQQWLMENSWRYGWILRYPNEKSEITGIIYEPWHYRYVGKTVAKEIYELDVCLEEYLEMLTNSVG